MRIADAKAVADLFSLPLSRVYELVRLDVIPHVRLGQRQIRFDLDALEQWARQGGATSSQRNSQNNVERQGCLSE